MSKERIFYAIAVLVFLVGGLFQTVGIVSNTVCTLGISLIFLVINIASKKNQKVIRYPFIILLGVIVASGVINSSSLPIMGLYIATFAVVPYSIYYFIKNNAFRFDFDKLFRFFLIIGTIQLPIVFTQEKLGPVIVAMSARGINLEDVGFGTFFFADDHGLCFFLLSLMVYLLYQQTKLKKASRLFYIIWFSLTIILANSNISSLLLIAILGSYFLIEFNPKTIFAVVALSLIVATTIFVTPLYDVFKEKYEFFQRKIFDKQTDYFDAEGAVEGGIPERSDVVVYMSHEDFKYIGDGPYKYFDPIKKVFPKFKNYSQYLWFYNDLGIIGVFCVFLVFGALYINNSKLFSFKIMYLALILAYSFFANTLSDLSFMIIFSIFVTRELKPILKRKKVKRYEHTMYPIPRLAEDRG